MEIVIGITVASISLFMSWHSIHYHKKTEKKYEVMNSIIISAIGRSE